MSLQGHHLNKLWRAGVPDAAYQVSWKSACRFRRRIFWRVFTIYGLRCHLGYMYVTGLSPGCYMLSFVEIDLSVPEKKIFDRFLPYRGVGPSWSCFTIYGHGGQLGHVPSIMSSDFHFLVPESFHAKFGSDRHSSFWENPVWIFVCTQPLAKVKIWPWPPILTYLHKLNYMSASTNFQVTGCNGFWKIHCYHSFL